jgi:putative photosynthetic complex assembly protein 2
VLSSLGPVFGVVAAWWLSTGLIFLLGRLSPRTFRWSLLGATALLPGALWTLHASSHMATALGACLGFGAAIAVWGWLEMSFLLGAVTGPRRAACAPGCGGRRHFRHAVEAILYHEIVSLMLLALALALSWHAANQYGLWTLLLLWGMRVSAKLNLHFGVPNIGAAMLPPHLKYLASFFRQRATSALFPVSVLIAAGSSIALVYASWTARAEPFQGTGLTLLATLCVLGLIEHGMLRLSLPADAFWGWMRRTGRRSAASRPATCRAPHPARPAPDSP